MLLGTAVGDALGVPYEFESIALPADEPPRMVGGGLGNFAPGEWSDDTAMALAVAQAAAGGADLASEAGLDLVAAGFLRWFAGDPPDVGNQTRAVLSRLRGFDPAGLAAAMTAASAAYVAQRPGSAGDGALMRTAPVVLAHLDDRARLAEAATRVAHLTHHGDEPAQSCVLWCESIRVAVVDGVIDFHAGLDLLVPAARDSWRARIDEAIAGPPQRFNPNGYTVSALQAAIAAISATEATDGEHLPAALDAAIRIGNDTDTVAAIAGGLLGARYGASSVPQNWRDAVHGWPHTEDGSPTDAAALRRWASDSLNHR